MTDNVVYTTQNRHDDDNYVLVAFGANVVY